MISLHGKATVVCDNGDHGTSQVFRISTNAYRRPRFDRKEIFYLKETTSGKVDASLWPILFYNHEKFVDEKRAHAAILPEELRYLSEGDLVRYNRLNGSLRVLYRPRIRFNALLLTERCNHFCLMCSQPPRDIDDGFIVKDLLESIPMMARNSGEICLSGGEPTLTGDGFYEIIESAKKHLPDTSLHVLTNGRHFNKVHNAQRLAEINHPDLMLGVPVYSDHPATHNFIVQGDNAFDETIRAIINLKAQGVKVEIRFVLHKYTVTRIREFGEFICRNLLFVDHVAFMGLETIGFAKSNIEELWVEPSSYMEDLSYACKLIAKFGGKPSVYNSQLCLLKADSFPFYRRSISDWKNEFLPECSNCFGKSHCCGFFASNQKYHSDQLKPFETNEELETFFTT